MQLSAASKAEQIKAGALVVFTRKSVGGLGLIKEPDGKKNWKVMDERGNESSIAPQDIRYIVPKPPMGQTYKYSDVARFSRWTQEEASEGDETLEIEEVPSQEERTELLDMAWELMVEEPNPEPFYPPDLAELVLGDASPGRCYGAFCMLGTEKGGMLFKKRKDGAFEVKSKAVVDVALQKAKVEDAKQAEREKFGKTLAAIIHARTVNPDKLPRDELPVLDMESLADENKAKFESLKMMAYLSVKPRDDPRPEEYGGGELLQLLGRASTRTNAFKLCQQLGLMDEHENLYLFDSEWAHPFPDAIVAEAQALLDDPPPDPDARIRRDLRGLKTYTIDSEDTVEVDDALSVETLEDGRERLWVHIADVSRYVDKDSGLYRMAKRRQTSLYLPEGTVPMMPMTVAGQLLSLNRGQDAYALSMGVLLNDDGSIADVEITPSLITVDMRLTYEEVDEMLFENVSANEERDISRLKHWADRRFGYRSQNGSVDRFSKAPQSNIKVKKDSSAEPDGRIITMTPDDPAQPSTVLVTEMMVMAGEACAVKAREAQIALPFRKQRAPESLPGDDWFESFPERYCRAQASYRFMSGAEVSSVPGPHFGLGIEAYVQWTSPIRRFNDMVVHYQLKQWLHSEAGAAPQVGGEEEEEEGGGSKAGPLPASEIMREVQSNDNVLGMGGRISRDCNRYWALEYLRREGSSREYEAVILGSKPVPNGGEAYMVVLTELGLQERLPEGDGFGSLSLGEVIMVKPAAPPSPRGMNLRLGWRHLTPDDQQEGGRISSDEGAAAYSETY